MDKQTKFAIHLGHGQAAVIPDYLSKKYWWAYIHPWAVKIFERQWLINLILWGNFTQLRDAALDAIGAEITGHTLQIACVYGDFTTRLTERLSAAAALDVVDIVPIQLQNLQRKLTPCAPIRLFQCNSASLDFAADAAYDQVVLFFLLHEQPAATRRATLREACRVIKPGGKIVILDYHPPAIWNPLRYLMYPVLRWLEPYALDLWRHELTTWLPGSVSLQRLTKQTWYGGLYQQIVLQKA